jgi:hypothetical protein
MASGDRRHGQRLIDQGGRDVRLDRQQSGSAHAPGGRHRGTVARGANAERDQIVHVGDDGEAHLRRRQHLGVEHGV